jgi:two-component system LytT family response regulator
MIRTIIIDDEHFGRQALSKALEQYCPEVEIIAVCEGPTQGINAIIKHKPHLVFLDIQMPEMSGFDVLQQLSPIEFEVIFVTSFDQYAIKAIKFSALDYLLKPIDVDDLIHAVKKMQERIPQKPNIYSYRSILHNIRHDAGKINRLAIPTTEGIDFFSTEDIIYLEADGNYTTIFLTNQRKHVVSKNLKEFESLLASSGFSRVHNSYLINLDHVRKYIKGEGGYVMLSEGHHVEVSRRRKDAFLNTLNRI